MSNQAKVYLDTNIVILGKKLPENKVIVELAKSNQIKLFVSQKVTMERRSKSYKQRKAIEKIFKNKHNLPKDKYFKLVNDAIKKKERYEKMEKEESKFWWEVKPENTKSTFEGLTMLGLLGPYFIELFDYKNERALLGELLDNYNIKHDDAFHLMEAHSGGMDYFLTNDTRLIKKSKKVPWLKLKVLTPNKFIEAFPKNEQE